MSVIAQNSDRYRVFALSANSNVKLLEKQCREYLPDYAVMYDTTAAKQLASELSDTNITVLSGIQGLEYIASHDETDCVMAAIVGGIGLAPTFAAVKAGKKSIIGQQGSPGYGRPSFYG